MSVKEKRANEIVESFDRVFGVEFADRVDHDHYDLSEGMVRNPANTTAIVVNTERLQEKFAKIHEKMDETCTTIQKGKPEDGYTTVAHSETDVQSVIQTEYLEQVAELYGWDSVPRGSIKMHGSVNDYPIRVEKDGYYVLIAPAIV